MVSIQSSTRSPFSSLLISPRLRYLISSCLLLLVASGLSSSQPASVRHSRHPRFVPTHRVFRHRHPSSPSIHAAVPSFFPPLCSLSFLAQPCRLVVLVQPWPVVVPVPSRLLVTNPHKIQRQPLLPVPHRGLCPSSILQRLSRSLLVATPLLPRQRRVKQRKTNLRLPALRVRQRGVQRRQPTLILLRPGLFP